MSYQIQLYIPILGVPYPKLEWNLLPYPGRNIVLHGATQALSMEMIPQAFG